MHVCPAAAKIPATRPYPGAVRPRSAYSPVASHKLPARRSVLLGTVPGRQLLAAAGQQRHVGTDEDESRPGPKVTRGQVGWEGVDAGRLARGGYRLDRVEPGPGLDLDQHRHGLSRPRQVPLHPVPARGPGQRAADAADPLMRIAGRRDQRPGLRPVLHHRDQQDLHPDVEQLLDQHWVTARWPDNRRHRVRGHRLELRQDRPQVVRRVLAVDEQPVEPGSGADLRADRAAGRDPHAGARRRAGQRRPPARRPVAQRNRHVTAPRSPKSAWMTSPAPANTGRVNEPDRITCPDGRISSYGASLLASQATPLAGWPSTPAATPVSSIASLTYSSAEILLRSQASGRMARPPTTIPASAALSEIVSTMVRR